MEYIILQDKIYNMRPVTSNAVYGAINGLVQRKKIILQTDPNGYTASAGGLLYKKIKSVSSEIGSGHTIIGMYLWDFGNTSNYPFDIFCDDADFFVWTTSQSLRGTFYVIVSYI